MEIQVSVRYLYHSGNRDNVSTSVHSNYWRTHALVLEDTSKECSQQHYRLQLKPRNRCPLIVKYIFKNLWYIHAVETSTAMKGNTLQPHEATQANGDKPWRKSRKGNDYGSSQGTNHLRRELWPRPTQVGFWAAGHVVSWLVVATGVHVITSLKCLIPQQKGF